MRHAGKLKIGYAIAFAFWTAYVAFRLFLVTVPDRNPNPMAGVYCFLLLTGIPAIGYVLLFKVFPIAGRALRKSPG